MFSMYLPGHEITPGTQQALQKYLLNEWTNEYICYSFKEKTGSTQPPKYSPFGRSSPGKVCLVPGSGSRRRGPAPAGAALTVWDHGDQSPSASSHLQTSGPSEVYELRLPAPPNDVRDGVAQAARLTHSPAPKAPEVECRAWLRAVSQCGAESARRRDQSRRLVRLWASQAPRSRVHHGQQG